MEQAHKSCITKITKITGLLHNLKLKFLTYILKSAYNTLQLPHKNYCILTWGSQIEKLHKLQKRSIRNVTKIDYRAHTEPLCKEHNLLKVYDIYYLTVLKFYSKLVNNNLPHYLSSFTPQLSAEQQNYNLRNPTMQFPRIKHKFPKQLLC